MIDPNQEQIEMALVASIFASPNSVGPRVADRLSPEQFANPTARAIYRAMLSLLADHKRIEFVPLVAEMGERQIEAIGGQATIARLTDIAPTGHNWQWYVEQIEAAHVRRSVESLGNRLLEIAQSPDADHLSEARQAFGDALQAASEAQQEKTWHQHVLDAFDASEAAATARDAGKLPGVPTGIGGLDDLTGGWRSGDLVVIGARPSVGKTAMLVHLALAALARGHSVGFCSMEMSGSELACRVLGQTSNVSINRIRDGRMTSDDTGSVVGAVAKVRDYGLHIDDRPARTVEQVAARAARWKQVNGISMLMVDYIGLMRSTSRRADRSRVLEVGEISHGLKALARELKLPVVVAAQLNREISKHGNRRPVMSDLRESGDIEQDADLVILLHSHRAAEERVHGLSAIVAKYRNGPTGIVNMRLDRETNAIGWDEFNELCQERKEAQEQTNERRYVR